MFGRKGSDKDQELTGREKRALRAGRPLSPARYRKVMAHEQAKAQARAGAGRLQAARIPAMFDADDMEDAADSGDIAGLLAACNVPQAAWELLSADASELGMSPGEFLQANPGHLADAREDYLDGAGYLRDL